jgi:LmbE family N-acetylglucosaminyl deacetylase
VVIAVACSGSMNAAAGPGGFPRLRELAASARALGAARVVHLGYADSGHGPVLHPDPPGMVRFARAVHKYAAQKRAALAAHRSHLTSRGRSARLGRIMLAMPVPVFGRLFGREWFVEPGVAAAPVSRDILHS